MRQLVSSWQVAVTVVRLPIVLPCRRSSFGRVPDRQRSGLRRAWLRDCCSAWSYRRGSFGHTTG